MVMGETTTIPLAKYNEAIAERYDRIAELENTVEKFKQMLFGRSSERRVVDPETGLFQGGLFETPMR